MNRGEPQYNISEAENYEFEGSGISFDLVTYIDVWGGPLSSAPHIIQTLIDHNLDREFQGANIIDVGTGNGIITIAALALGANHVCAVDNNSSAITNTLFNLRYNHFKKTQADVISSDVLNGVSASYKADIIIGNLPMNPEINGLNITNPAFRSNQNGGDGRYVQSTLIRQSLNHLNPGGLLVFSASSRQNFAATKNDLDNYFGSNNWTIINSAENKSPVDNFEGAHEEISMEYHGPFIPTWLLETSIDRKLRVYNLDENGHPYLELESGRGKDRVKKIFCYVDIERNNEFIPIEVYINGNGIPIYSAINSDGSIQPLENDDIRIPEKISDTLYHNYSIVVARYSPDHVPES